MSEADIGGVRITSPDRVLARGPSGDLTKRDLAEHYARVAERMLPHAARRPLTLVRCPRGVGADCFFQKHVQDSFPEAIGRVAIEEKEGTASYPTISDRRGLISLAQLAVIEVHINAARVDRLDRPDRVVFDLDPGPGVTFAEVVKAAGDVRAALKRRELASFPLLTGSKGIHVVVPIERRSSWAAAHDFAREVAQQLSAEAPERFVAAAAKSKRERRIFIDWLRNGPSATAVCPWSPRAKPGLPVAMPVSWAELGGVKASDAFDIKSAAARLNADPWGSWQELRQRLRTR